VTIVTGTKFLAVLLTCETGRADGFVLDQTPNGNEGPVKNFPHNALVELLERYGRFQRKYGSIALVEQQSIKGLLLLSEAVRAKKHQMISDLAHPLARLFSPTEDLQAELWEGIKHQPLRFLERKLGERVSRAKLVVWRQRNGSRLAAGIHCKDALEALYVLTVFRVGVGVAGTTGECVICGKVFVRERGNRRETCSDKCRKKKSRLNNSRETRPAK
jgi:hypothetical protein